MKARSFPLSQITSKTVDLNDFAGGDGLLFVRDGVGFASRGIRARGNARQIQQMLDNIEYEQSTYPIGVGPVSYTHLTLPTKA